MYTEVKNDRTRHRERRAGGGSYHLMDYEHRTYTWPLDEVVRNRDLVRVDPTHFRDFLGNIRNVGATPCDGGPESILSVEDNRDFLKKQLQHQKQQFSDFQIFRKLMDLLTKETLHIGIVSCEARSTKMTQKTKKAIAGSTAENQGQKEQSFRSTGKMTRAHETDAPQNDETHCD